VVVVPQQQGGSSGGSGSSGGGGQAPQQPQEPAGEVCSLSGSASVNGGSGGLSSSGGSYTANGPSSVTVSGYPTCHSPRYGIKLNGPHGFASGCFLDNFNVPLNSSQAGDTITVSITLGC
jgi:hypothetical protein